MNKKSSSSTRCSNDSPANAIDDSLRQNALTVGRDRVLRIPVLGLRTTPELFMAQVEEALDAATAGDLEPLTRLLSAVSAPYDERPGLERYAEPGPEDFATTYRTFCGT